MIDGNNVSKLLQNEFKESGVKLSKDARKNRTTGFDIFRHSIRSTN